MPPHRFLLVALILQHRPFHSNKIQLKLFTKTLSSCLLSCFSLKCQDQLLKQNQIRILDPFERPWVMEMSVRVTFLFLSENHSCNGQSSNSTWRGAGPQFPMTQNPHTYTKLTAYDYCLSSVLTPLRENWSVLIPSNSVAWHTEGSSQVVNWIAGNVITKKKACLWLTYQIEK